jgi:hypothetical protein
MDNMSLFEDYLDGVLDDGARARFETDLRADPELAASLQEHKALRDLIVSYGILEARDKLRAYEKRNYGARIRFWRWLAIVSVILLLAWMGRSLFLRKQTPATPEAIYAAYFSPYRDPVHFRSTDAIPENRAKANDAYRHGDFKTAAISYAQIENPSQADSLYWGLSAWQSGDADSAIQLLSRLSTGHHDYQQQARWYLVLAHVKLGEIAQAQLELEPLLRANDFKAQEAKKLVEDLRTLVPVGK